MRAIWRYSVPILMIFIGVSAFSTKPGQTVSKSIPIIPGEYRMEVAGGFVLLGLILGAVVYLYGRSHGRG